ncbi:MAG: GNAT family N-acetyltransferase [Prevotella sp.]|nr:GNAT family N-acetyltransferase [Prevotella sp.]MBQ8714533.1 GNAT family N-acetyltransferase [Prevotella sp.]
MFEIKRYTPDKAGEWNKFVAQSKNGTFLFDRQYMDYHADRFHDYSLMFYKDDRLLAVLPAHVNGDTLYSHNGLTYGGLVMDTHLTIVQTVALFREMNLRLRDEGFRHVHYKCVPWIYHRLSAEEDLYALYHECKARLVARDFATNIFLQAGMRWERIRRRGVIRAKEAGVSVERSDDYAAFWTVLADNLGTKYGVKPVHTLTEIELLHHRFPDNIILYQAVKAGKVIGGVVLYVTPQVVHAQYSSATPEGKKLGVMDLLYDQILHRDYKDYPYFDFGRSTEQPDGGGLNEQLVFQKEGFGGRGLCYDIYDYDL